MAKGKLGRNKKWCESYRKRDQRKLNKRRKMIRHLKAFPNDNAARRYYAQTFG